MSQKTIKFRPHRGLLEDAMKELVEIPATKEALVAHLQATALIGKELRNVFVKPYGGPDTRIGWSGTYIVTEREDGGVLGFTTGPVSEFSPTSASLHKFIPFDSGEKVWIKPVITYDEKCVPVKTIEVAFSVDPVKVFGEREIYPHRILTNEGFEVFQPGMFASTRQTDAISVHVFKDRKIESSALCRMLNLFMLDKYLSHSSRGNVYYRIPEEIFHEVAVRYLCESGWIGDLSVGQKKDIRFSRLIDKHSVSTCRYREKFIYMGLFPEADKVPTNSLVANSGQLTPNKPFTAAATAYDLSGSLSANISNFYEGWIRTLAHNAITGVTCSSLETSVANLYLEE